MKSTTSRLLVLKRSLASLGNPATELRSFSTHFKTGFNAKVDRKDFKDHNRRKVRDSNPLLTLIQWKDPLSHS